MEMGGITERIYLDHAASTPLDEDVLRKMLPYFTQNFGNANSQHYFGRRAMAALDDARGTIASLIGAKENEVFFTSGGTEGDNIAMFGAARAIAKKGRKKLLVSAVEHYAVSVPAERLAEEEGFDLRLIPVDKRGAIDLGFLRREADENTALVSVMTASNELGTIEPVKEAAEIAHAAGALFFTDAVQAAPYLPLNVKETNVDAMAFSAHKFYGPKGTGILYVKSGAPVERLIVGGENENGFRGGTVNVAGAVGAAAAYEKAVRETEENDKKISALKDLFVKEISAYPFAHINGGIGEDCVPSVLNLRLDGADNQTMLNLMDLNGIAASAGSACAGGDIQPSRVLLAAGFTPEEIKNSFRLSFGKYNTEEETRRAAKIIGDLAKRLIG